MICYTIFKQECCRKSCTLFFRENPLKIVRGSGQYLYDEQGNEYLDCINNVAHVLAHLDIATPHVVNAAAVQNSLLCTNSRFLHDNIVSYAKRLISYFPENLSVCYFVNSGSEATDLALQLARSHTGRKDVIVLEDAYHGHLLSAMNVSPYKFRKINGHKQKKWVHVTPLPCRYRGKFQADQYSDYDSAYAKDFEMLVQDMQARGYPPGAFLAEALPSCAGQIIPPKWYFKNTFAAVRAAGGVCIMDEVQTGFGRIGHHMWAFQLHEVEPDIVTIGKPIGNGHPVAAVVTTPAIAQSHSAIGTGYFNTFGGNPVSLAVTNAVLDVIEKEKLQKHAKEIGEFMLHQLLSLKSRHILIGDVRGVGMFIGIDLVSSPLTKQPATEEAQWILRRLKLRRILMSTDGRHDNVLKFKPPLVFSKDDGKKLIGILDEILTEAERKFGYKSESLGSHSTSDKEDNSC
ncbi:PHYKPL [Cordylochernes scorpioides]|uniref:PHYKPL n=1 Tax=Cordylochernes scorpioides TaxID=51811 RepID=A0ABY6LT12_9ARAC|nr:PHYKPL [Cordylochernes scorpioides]